MSALAEIYFKKETLETLLKGVNQKGINGIGITVSINDETKVFNGKTAKGEDYEVLQNVSAFVSQSKEERDAKKDKYYVANGRVVWTDGTVVRAEKPTTTSEPQAEYNAPSGGNDDIPF